MDKHHQDPKIAWVAACLPLAAFALKPLLHGRVAAAAAVICGLVLLVAVGCLLRMRHGRIRHRDNGQVS